MMQLLLTFSYTLHIHRRPNKPVSRSISLLGLPAAPGVAVRTVKGSEINSLLNGASSQSLKFSSMPQLHLEMPVTIIQTFLIKILSG